MTFIVGGLIGLALTCLVFWRMLPGTGLNRAFVETVWEPWVASAFTLAFGLTLATVVAGVADLFL